MVKAEYARDSALGEKEKNTWKGRNKKEKRSCCLEWGVLPASDGQKGRNTQKKNTKHPAGTQKECNL